MMHDLTGLAAAIGFGILIGGGMVAIRMDTPELNTAQSYCLTNQGVDYIMTRALQQNSVFCKNGAKFILEEGK